MRVLIPFLALAANGADPYSFDNARGMLKQYCVPCHAGKSNVGGFNIDKYAVEASLAESPRAWANVLTRVRSSEMPPKGKPAPALDERERFTAWLDHWLRAAACADGISPLAGPVRRLNRSEYTNTVRDLLNVPIDAGHALPADGAGGEGFDNAAETLFLSPIHAEKYLDAAKQALDYAMKDPRSRNAVIVSEPGPKGSNALTPEEAARRVLTVFLPRAFRRPVEASEIEKHLTLFRAAAKRGDGFNDAITYTLQAVLISPYFLFRLEDQNPNTGPRLVGDYAMASRLSYFLWGGMPDQALFNAAAAGRLHDPAGVGQQIDRMLSDQKTREFAENFTGQWLGTRELGRDIKPDAKLFAGYYDAELQSAIKYEPILFFQEIFAENLSLLNLLDADFTIATGKLLRHYGLPNDKKIGQQPLHALLPPNSNRGGLTGMAAVLAVSSYPARTSPVLRGKWVLDAILGTPPPPPPPNVPELKEQPGEAAKTLRERLELHRANPVCAGCHSRIDPIGFGLENFDVLGRWRAEEAGKPIDATGELADGTTFKGPAGLKKVLLGRKDLFLRNLTSKMLGYSLGRGLTIEDQCAVDRIVAELGRSNYSAHVLIKEIAMSAPFRYQPGTNPKASIR